MQDDPGTLGPDEPAITHTPLARHRRQPSSACRRSDSCTFTSADSSASSLDSTSVGTAFSSLRSKHQGFKESHAACASGTVLARTLSTHPRPTRQLRHLCRRRRPDRPRGAAAGVQCRPHRQRGHRVVRVHVASAQLRRSQHGPQQCHVMAVARGPPAPRARSPSGPSGFGQQRPATSAAAFRSRPATKTGRPSDAGPERRRGTARAAGRSVSKRANVLYGRPAARQRTRAIGRYAAAHGYGARPSSRASSSATTAGGALTGRTRKARAQPGCRQDRVQGRQRRRARVASPRWRPTDRPRPCDNLVLQPSGSRLRMGALRKRIVWQTLTASVTAIVMDQCLRGTGATQQCIGADRGVSHWRFRWHSRQRSRSIRRPIPHRPLPRQGQHVAPHVPWPRLPWHACSSTNGGDGSRGPGNTPPVRGPVSVERVAIADCAHDGRSGARHPCRTEPHGKCSTRDAWDLVGALFVGRRDYQALHPTQTNSSGFPSISPSTSHKKLAHVSKRMRPRTRCR